MPKFSIIIPMYNAEEYIADCLDCVVGQTFAEFEAIVVDDGSNDESVHIVEKYAQKDHRIVLVKLRHRNAGAARNAGLGYVTGDYVIFLDADDRFSLKLLESIAASVTEAKEEIVIWDGSSFDSRTGEKKELDYLLVSDLLEGKIFFSAREAAGRLYQITAGILWNKAFSYEFLLRERIEFQDIERSNDVFFVFIALASACKIKIIKERLVFYRTNNDKSLQGTPKGRSLHFYSALLMAKQELEKRELYHLYENTFSEICLVHCINELNMRRNGEDFAFVYNRLKNDIFKNLGIQKMKAQQCSKPEYFAVFEEINSKSIYEYLYDRGTLEIERVTEIINAVQAENAEKSWIIPYAKIPRGAEIVLFGAGKMGQDYQCQIAQTGYWHLKMWVDSNDCKYRKMGLPVQNPDAMNGQKFEYVLVAVRDDKPHREIAEYLYARGIDREKII